jgi:cell division protein FtsQ
MSTRPTKNAKTAAQPRNRRVSSKKQRKQQHLLDVKVRSRAANRQRDRRILTWLSVVVLVGAAIGGIMVGGRAALRRFFWQNPDYNLAEVQFHTDGSLTRDEVLAATGIQEGKNIFTINLGNARKGLVALPQVDRADIERILPNKISIEIAERKPVAWVTGKDDDNPSADPGAFLADKTGLLLRVKKQVPEYYHLPVICGLQVDNYDEGQVIDLPEMRAALELIRLTGENPAKYQVRSIDISKGYCLVVTDERHAKITFPLDNIDQQLNRLAMLYADVDTSAREIQTVNLLVQRNIPVTFVPPIDSGTDAADAYVQASPSPSPQPSPGTKKTAQPLTAKKTSAKTAITIHKPKGYVYHEPTVRRAIPVQSQ